MPCNKNAFRPPPPPAFPVDIHLSTLVEAYDLNFCFSEPTIDVLRGEDRLVMLDHAFQLVAGGGWGVRRV